MARVDLTGWAPGGPLTPELIYTFDERARGLNGSCLLAPGVLAVADCFAGLIWRVDLAQDARHATAREWLAHDTMAFDPDSELPPPPQPGVNGVRFGPRTGHLYYTSTAQKVFMRVAVDPSTLTPATPPEFVAAIDNADDFCLDEQAGFAYITRHRANTIDRAPLRPRHGSEVRPIAGDPFDDTLVGPSSAAWGPADGEQGRIAYVITDGGTTAPPDGVVRRAAVLRVELAYATPASGRGATRDPARRSDRAGVDRHLRRRARTLCRRHPVLRTRRRHRLRPVDHCASPRAIGCCVLSRAASRVLPDR